MLNEPLRILAPGFSRALTHATSFCWAISASPRPGTAILRRSMPRRIPSTTAVVPVGRQSPVQSRVCSLSSNSLLVSGHR